MDIQRFVFNTFQENTYVVWDTSTRQCAIVDPGMMSSREENVITDFIRDNKLVPLHLINTHLHIDHVIGDKYIKDVWRLPVSANNEDMILGNRLRDQAMMFGFDTDVVDVVISKNISDGDEVHIGNGSLKVLQVPGHSPGSIALYDESDEFVITGDALFRFGIGRTDLPGGDYNILINSIKNKLLTLPKDTIVYPGHGPATTIGEEIRHNPFLI